MFGDKKEYCCCNCHSVSVVGLRIEYEQKIQQLQYEINKRDRLIEDLTETNKHLSRAVKPTTDKGAG